VKEFVVYTLLRIALFAGTLAVVVGLWALVADDVFVPGALVIAFVISGVASLTLLDRPREAFARRVQERATIATKAIQERRAREDADDDAARETPGPPETTASDSPAPPGDKPDA